MSPRNVATSPVISPLGSSLLVRANEGRPSRAFGHAIVVLLNGKQTGGKFTTFLNITPPGGGPRPHYHERFHIIEGQVSVLMNGTWTDLFPGDCVYSSRSSVHGFKNNMDRPIRVFINIAHAGFEHFFAEAGEEWAQPELDMSHITTIAEKYGLHGA
jgi:quercetin dioxygenase-like cupin family protein